MTCWGTRFLPSQNTAIFGVWVVAVSQLSISWSCLLITYLFTTWSRVLLQKLTGSQPVKNFPAFCGTRRFITAFTSARHLSLSLASSIQSMPPHPTSWISFLILPSHLRLGLLSGHFPSGFPTEILYTSLLSPIRATCPAHLILLDFIARTIFGEQYRSLSSSLCSFLHSPVTSSLLGPNIPLSTVFSNTLSLDVNSVRDVTPNAVLHRPGRMQSRVARVARVL